MSSASMTLFRPPYKLESQTSVAFPKYVTYTNAIELVILCGQLINNNLMLSITIKLHLYRNQLKS